MASLIREAVKADLPALIAIYASDEVGAHGEANPAPMSVYEAAFAAIEASPDNVLFVLEDDGRVVGTLQITFIPGLVGHGRLSAKLEAVHVLSSERGKGFGEKLVSHAEGVVRARGAGLIELSSNKARLAAHRFYERLGYAKSHEGFKKKM